MHKKLGAMMIAVALALAGASLAVSSDSVTSCGVAQLKAYNALYQALLKEATRACGAGSAGSPAPLDSAKLTAAETTFNTAVQNAIDQFGAPNCFITMALTPGSTLSAAQGVADQLCIVPVPTATP